MGSKARPLVVVQARPNNPPSWWPGEWVTVRADGSGWTAGLDATQATRSQRVVRSAKNAFLWDYTDDNDKVEFGGFTFREVKVDALS